MVLNNKRVFSVYLNGYFFLFVLLMYKNISQQERDLFCFFKNQQQSLEIYSSVPTNHLKTSSYSLHNVACIKNPLITDYN